MVHRGESKFISVEDLIEKKAYMEESITGRQFPYMQVLYAILYRVCHISQGNLLVQTYYKPYPNGNTFYNEKDNKLISLV
jgi:hypothetical protein